MCLHVGPSCLSPGPYKYYIYIFKRTPTHIIYYMIYIYIYIYLYTLHLLIMPYRSMHIASYFSAAASTLPPWGCGTSERLWPERWTMRSRLTSKVAGRCAGTRNPVWFWSHIYPIEVCIHDITWHNRLFWVMSFDVELLTPRFDPCKPTHLGVNRSFPMISCHQEESQENHG